MRRTACLAIAVTLLAACGGGAHQRDAGTTTETVVRTISSEELSSPDSVRTCVDFDSPPFAFRQDGRATGFEVQLLERIARRLGLRPVWVPTPRPDFAAALKARKCDVIVSRLGYDLDTQFRLNVGALQYMALPLVLVVPAGSATTPVSMADLCGRTLAVVAWTAPAFLAREQRDACRKAGAGALQLREAASSEGALAMVKRGRAHAVLEDVFSAKPSLSGAGDFATVEITDRKGYIALGYRRPGLSTEAGLHAALLTLYEDGVVRPLVRRWRLDQATLLPLP